MEGKIIKGPFWNEPIVIEKIEEFDNYIRLVGYKRRSKEYINQVIKKEDLEKIEVLKSEIDFSSNPENIFF